MELWSPGCGSQGKVGTMHLAKQTHTLVQPLPTSVVLQPGRTLGRKGPDLALEEHCKDNREGYGDHSAQVPASLRDSVWKD